MLHPSYRLLPSVSSRFPITFLYFFFNVFFPFSLSLTLFHYLFNFLPEASSRIQQPAQSIEKNKGEMYILEKYPRLFEKTFRNIHTHNIYLPKSKINLGICKMKTLDKYLFSRYNLNYCQTNRINHFIPHIFLACLFRLNIFTVISDECLARTWRQIRIIHTY